MSLHRKIGINSLDEPAASSFGHKRVIHPEGGCSWFFQSSGMYLSKYTVKYLRKQ
jgi:hypothetical protein